MLIPTYSYDPKQVRIIPEGQQTINMQFKQQLERSEEEAIRNEEADHSTKEGVL